jgi:hypothetical protein
MLGAATSTKRTRLRNVPKNLVRHVTKPRPTWTEGDSSAVLERRLIRAFNETHLGDAFTLKGYDAATKGNPAVRVELLNLYKGGQQYRIYFREKLYIVRVKQAGGLEKARFLVKVFLRARRVRADSLELHPCGAWINEEGDATRKGEATYLA